MAEENEEIKKSVDADTGAGNDAANGKLAEIEKQRDEYLAGWQRTKADFLNYKKEELSHLEEVSRYGNADIMKDLISVMDNFDLALRTLEKEGSVEKGIYLIRTQIEDLLKKRGLANIDIKEGDAFDPMVAEALAEIPSDKPEGTVVEVIERGYRLHEKVLRPARVIVSKGT
ncbi:MAG: nucleotide exchange factor GrpE [Candidatus Pacebacteria bacterium]|nr:nucleotide exchange factor GrpE [Candidatus Paceibacterota bacterium]